MENKPILTVNVITYNHEPYISQCLDSILSQNTKYNFIIRIFDDCSTDKTINICENYVKKYPDKIYFFPNSENKGDVQNVRRSYDNITTKYYMYIEGDDYCCNDNKFQMQIQILENHPELVFCSHYTKIKNEGDKLLHDNDKLYCPLSGGILKYNDLLTKYRSIFNTHISSRIVRTKCIKFPEIFFRLYLFDATQMLLLLEQGDMYNIPEIMSVYRETGKGLYSGAKAKDRIEHYFMHMLKYQEYSKGKLDLLIYKAMASYVNFILRELRKIKIEEENTELKIQGKKDLQNMLSFKDEDKDFIPINSCKKIKDINIEPPPFSTI